MAETIKFTNFVTKGLEINDEKRIFKGHITAEIVDRQNEFVAIQEVLKKMGNYMAVAPNVSEVHSNRTVGKVDLYKQSEIEGHPSVYIEAHVFKQDGVTLYDHVWEKVKTGVYKGLSMGGASKTKDPIVKDGQLVMALKDLEIYEIALCPTPANPLAIIDYVNEFAKSNNMMESIKIADGGRPYIQCNSIMCSVEKSNGTNLDADIDLNNDQTIQKIKEEMMKDYEYFNKPFAGYSDFASCVSSNKDKGDPEAYCGEIKHKVEKHRIAIEKVSRRVFEILGYKGGKEEKIKEEIEKWIWSLEDKKSTNEGYHNRANFYEDYVMNGVQSERKEEDQLIKILEKTILKNTISN